MDSNDRVRMQILEMIESGKIRPDEGIRLIQSLSGEVGGQLPEGALQDEAPAGVPATDDAAPESSPPPDAGPAAQPAAGTRPPPLPPDAETWRSWWQVPLWVGVGVLLASALLMYSALQASGLGFWFFCAGVPFLLGLLLVVVGWQSRTAHWLHLRIAQKPGAWPRRLAFSFPLPMRFTAWFLRTFRDRIPSMQHTSVDDVILAVENTTSRDNPLYIQVEEGQDGEKVEILIG